jgi:hypothetical protein
MKVQRFRSWNLFPSSGKKKGRPGLRLVQPKAPTDRLCVLFLPILPEDGSRIQLPKRCNFKVAIFLVVAPCSLVDVYQRFRGPYSFHHRPDDGGSKDL